LTAGARDARVTAQASLEVVDGGLLTTVQDAGRADWTHLGVPESGAADRWSLAVANLLVANDPGAAALEMTLGGPTLVARAPLTIALAGADLRARIRGGRRLAPGRSHRLVAGEVVEISGDDAASPADAVRGYLAIAGGIDVPIVLGSRSTCLAGEFGGLAGRALATGDVLVAGAPGRPPPELVWPEPDAASEVGSGRDPGRDAGDRPVILRVLPFGSGLALEALTAQPWRAGSAADRVGVRLEGDPLPAGIGGETTTHGVPWGAIQVPPDGRPILLGVDHQVTGGYRVVGVVMSADLPLLGQLRPGAAVRLAATTAATALEALRARRAALDAGAAALREAAGWDALVDAAGS
jgi:antagonist of KipI